MDEFIQEALKKKDVINLNAETISRQTGQILVLGKKGDYELNTKLRMLPGITFIEPNSAEGKLFENDETILRAEDFLGKEKDVRESPVFDYSMFFRDNILSRKYGQNKDEGSLSRDDPVKFVQKSEPVLAADDYNEHKASDINQEIHASNIIPIYRNRSYNPSHSWYSQFPRGGLETKMQYYRPRSFARADPPLYYNSSRDNSAPYRRAS